MTAVVLETERLRLRRFRDDDLDTLARWNADPRFRRYLGRPSLTRAETRTALGRYDAHWQQHGFGLLAAEDRETGTLVGRSGVAFHYVWADDPELGWSFDPAWWGRGLATEAGAACAEWAFGALGLRRLVSISLPHNLASLRVMEKLGFRKLTERFDERYGLLLWVHVLDRS